MSVSNGSTLRLIILLIAAVGAGIAIVFFFGHQIPAPPVIVSTTVPTPSTIATSAPATAPSLETYGQLLHADYPHYPQTLPWAVPVELSDAAHLVLSEPVYVCSRGDLWITRAGADPLPQVLSRAAGESEHIVDRKIFYVIWTLNHRGAWDSAAVCPTDHGYEIVSTTGVQPIPWNRPYRWDLAMTWADDDVNRLIVPTDLGVSIITLGASLSEDYFPLVDAASTRRPVAAPAVVFDTRGVLAWIPADDHFSDTVVARFLDGKWNGLDRSSWPGDVVYLVPLLDGSVLQIRREDGPSALSFVSLDSPDIDSREISALVDQLGDDDPDKRVEAYQKLAQFGPKINPLLQTLSTNAAPEAQSRIHQLLAGATLGGIAINGNQLLQKCRLRDGGMVFIAPQGVTIAREGQEPTITSPDFLAVRPGRPAQELPAPVVAELSKSAGSIDAFGDDWIIGSPDAGPERFLPPDQLVPILRPTEKNFSRMLAIDSRDRWLLRDDSSGKTLVLDPTVPDPTPRLAIWSIDTGISAGWNKSDWPAIARDKSHWIIDDHDWEPMDSSDAMSVDLPASAPGAPLLIDSDGNHFFDGQTTLTVVTADGKRHIWALPDEIAGASDYPPRLSPDLEGHLFLFNSTGRIARLRETFSDTQPFVLEAVFSDHVPDYRDVQRIWRDPAGRIDIAYEQSHLDVIFPTGQIPREIADKILPQDLKRLDSH